MTEIKPIESLAIFDLQKQGRQDFISVIMDSIDNGVVDPLTIHLYFKNIEKIAELISNTDEKKNKDGFEIAKRYKAAVLAAAEKYGQKKFEFRNSVVEIKEVGTKYDYSQCGDTELDQWLAESAALDVKIKERQKMLQFAPSKGMTVVNESTGETTTVYPPSKSSTTSIQVTLK